MKKIIATVLAMVMALALCTTAFAAAQKYDAYDAATGLAVASEQDKILTYHAAETGKIAYYTLDTITSGENGETITAGTDKYVKCAAADAEFVLKYDGKDIIAMYVAKVTDIEYVGEGVAYTNIGTACGQYKLAAGANGETTADKFYTATSKLDQKVHLFVKDSAGAVNLLVNGMVVKTTDKGTLDSNLVGHTWVVDVEKGIAKCSNCNATGKVYKTFVEVPNGVEADMVAGVWVVADKTATKPADGTNSSPKTFDAGIAMYVGMALTSVAGSAVVIGKKKEV